MDITVLTSSFVAAVLLASRKLFAQDLWFLDRRPDSLLIWFLALNSSPSNSRHLAQDVSEATQVSCKINKEEKVVKSGVGTTKQLLEIHTFNGVLVKRSVELQPTCDVDAFSSSAAAQGSACGMSSSSTSAAGPSSRIPPLASDSKFLTT